MSALTHSHGRLITPAFMTADWSAVLADSSRDSAQAHDALTRLCRTYWHPLYAYVRMRGYGPEDAQELTHRFFAQLAESNLWDEMAGARTRVRSFFLTALNRFLDAEHAGLPRASADAEKVFVQNWALALLNVVYDRLRFEYETADKAEIFETLKFCLTSRGEALPGEELARKLGVADTTLKTLAGRLRQRYSEILREEAAHSVASAGDVEDELKYLAVALAP